MLTLHWIVIATSAGVISHLALFIRGEWGKHALPLLKSDAEAELIIIIIITLIFRQQSPRTYDSVSLFLALNLGHWLGFFGSIGVYSSPDFQVLHWRS